MPVLTFLGDKYGISRISAFSTKYHLRPLDYDSGAHCIEHYVRMGNVESVMGKSSDTSNICGIQLSCSKP